MQPVALAANIDAGFIGVDPIRLGQTIFDPNLEAGSPVAGFPIEVEQRPRAQGNADLIFEVLANAIVGQQLILRQIDRMRLQSGTVLHRTLDAGWKWRHDAPALGVFQNLGLVLGDKATDVEVDDLALFVAHQTERTALG